MWYQAVGAASPVGPLLVTIGVSAIVAGGVVHGLLGRPTLWSRDTGNATDRPHVLERVSVHLIAFALWAVGFGWVNWRGVPAGLIDVRLPFEREWPVIEWTEWIYFSVYLVPMTMPWVATRRDALRRFCRHLGWLLAISLTCFWLLPFGAPARAFEPASLAGRLLAWETGRADFAAASWPSFHVFWGLLCASLLATRSRRAGILGWAWAVAVAVSCVANGAHALADVAASVAIYAALLAVDPVARRPRIRPMMIPRVSPASAPPMPK